MAIRRLCVSLLTIVNAILPGYFLQQRFYIVWFGSAPRQFEPLGVESSHLEMQTAGIVKRLGDHRSSGAGKRCGGGKSLPDFATPTCTNVQLRAIIRNLL